MANNTYPFLSSLSCTVASSSGSSGLMPKGSNLRSPGSVYFWMDAPSTSRAAMAMPICTAARGRSVHTCGGGQRGGGRGGGGQYTDR